MIRLVVLVVLPLAAPYAAWYLWRIFVAAPRLDPATGDQLPPEFDRAPKGRLLAASFVLMALVIGGFLLAHDHFDEDPYRPIDVNEHERRSAAGSR